MIAYILAGGIGRRIWPYAQIRNKCMIPVANEPLMSYLTGDILNCGIDKIVIVGGHHMDEVKNYFRNQEKVNVVDTGNQTGACKTLQKAFEICPPSEDFIVFYGDTVISMGDINTLIQSYDKEKGINVLISPIPSGDNSKNYIGCSTKDGKITAIGGHSRRGFQYQFCAFMGDNRFYQTIMKNSSLFTQVDIGAMPPVEAYIEMSVYDYINDFGEAPCVIAKDKFLDMDKPWDILLASSIIIPRFTSKLTSNELADGASIHESAYISGFVKLGKNSKIGRNVTIEGNVIIGDNTVIDNGATLGGNNIIGDNCRIYNYCIVNRGSTVGNNCIIKNSAELSGIIFESVYLYHYMEFSGVLGRNSDLGAATVCASLRFDDANSPLIINGRREYNNAANCTFMGDFTRTGVNVTLMPGVKIGVYSVIGPCVLVSEDVPDNTALLLKQETFTKEWGPEKYGW